MKAIISSTYDDKYLYFIPICVWAWNKLGVDVICFMPLNSLPHNDGEKLNLIQTTLNIIDAKCKFELFKSTLNKEATYAQCSRLYAACLDLSEDEIICTSDCDMALFKIPPYIDNITIFGSDLVPKGQFPICYASGTVKEWRSAMKLNGLTYQQCLDNLLGLIECEHMRGNYWSKDQQTLWENICDIATLVPRTNGQNQFATKRYDRDDAYILDRLNPDTIDFHMCRPGYEESNFNIILTILKYHYPHDSFDWLVNYTNEYRKLI